MYRLSTIYSRYPDKSKGGAACDWHRHDFFSCKCESRFAIFLYNEPHWPPPWLSILFHIDPLFEKWEKERGGKRKEIHPILRNDIRRAPLFFNNYPPSEFGRRKVSISGSAWQRSLYSFSTIPFNRENFQFLKSFDVCSRGFAWNFTLACGTIRC